MKPIDNQIRALGMVLPDGLWGKKQSTLQGLKDRFHSGLETLLFTKAQEDGHCRSSLKTRTFI